LPHCDVFADDDYTKEEIKLMKEPKKILGDDTFNLTATAVRVPVQGGHSESVNIEFENEFDLEEVRKILSETPGVVLQDNVKNNEYPMPLYSKEKMRFLWEESDGIFHSRKRSISGLWQTTCEKELRPTPFRLLNTL
jgi:aspartate-semialdehyde dehydrogenase